MLIPDFNELFETVIMWQKVWNLCSWRS